MTHKKTQASILRKKNWLHILNSLKADSLTGFIAGFLVGVIGMYVYAFIISFTP